MWLETERLYIRDFTEDDVDVLYEIKYDKQVYEYIPDYLERGITKEKVKEYIRTFKLLEEKCDIEQWRVYAVVNKQTREVIGSISFGKNEMLHEYELGWQILSGYTCKGYASEAAAAFAEHFCEQNGVDYLIVIMDVDNSASYRTAEKCGFRLFERRTVYDYFYGRYCDDYYYFRRYYSGSTLKEQFYGDVVYDGRSGTDAETHEIERIMEKALGCRVESIRKIENVPNNSVWSVEAAGDAYILKFYRSTDWPEDGKLPFVHRLLREKGVPCAELISFIKADADDTTRYLIERKVQGISADRIGCPLEQKVEFYAKLAEIVSRVHAIEIGKFGYIGDGVPDCDSMAEFFEDEFDKRIKLLVKLGVYDASEIAKMNAILQTAVHRFRDLPAVICHGDLGEKNVMIGNDGTLTLIDWDDAIALNWMADVARMTFYMRMQYGDAEYKRLRNAFMEHYKTPFKKAEFDEFERPFHIWTGLDSLVYHINKGDDEVAERIQAYVNQIVDRSEFL